jgi:hypothetical protein
VRRGKEKEIMAARRVSIFESGIELVASGAAR